jgi:hypothetical protein
MPSAEAGGGVPCSLVEGGGHHRSNGSIWPGDRPEWRRARRSPGLLAPGQDRVVRTASQRCSSQYVPGAQLRPWRPLP